MRKVDDGEKRKKKRKKEKTMLFIVATNVVASRSPERRPTGTLHARAKNEDNLKNEGKLKNEVDLKLKMLTLLI